jgi:hypothetical protein
VTTVRCTIWSPQHGAGLGALIDVEFDATHVADGVRTARVTVSDPDFDGTVPTGRHGRGGGPLASSQDRHAAVQFGVWNAAYHADLAVARAERWAGRALPHLQLRLGEHGHWGGGHYRLPAESLDPAERLQPSVDGEIHLGRGTRYCGSGDDRYFNAAAHNASIIYHEVGHHLCRHTADFRVNALRPALAQDNGKTPIDEGTCDFFAATLLGQPDIFGWHRSDQPRHAPTRRAVDGELTMASFRGGHEQDPHIDGTIWSAALWAARVAALHSGATADSFDVAVGRALVALGPADVLDADTRKTRRYVGRAAAAVIAASAPLGTNVTDAVTAAFERRWILPGRSNAELRNLARSALVGGRHGNA